MTTENHLIDQLFKEKLGNLEKNPRVGLMDQISQQMAYRGKVRRMNQVKAFIGIAAALVMIVMAGWFAMDQNQIVKNQVPQQNNSPAQVKTDNEAVGLKATENQIATNQKTSNATTAIASVKTIKSPVVQHKTVATKLSSGQVNLLTSQTSSDELSKSVPSTENQTNKSSGDHSISTKEKSKTENGTNGFQKKNPPLYFADAGINKSTRSNGFGNGNWALKAEISPMVSSQNLTGTTSDTKQSNTIGGGMLASYQVSKRIKVSSGIRYSQMKQDTHSSYTMSQTSGITYLQPVEKAANLAGDVSLYIPAVASIVYSNGMKTNPTDNFTSDISQEFKYLEVPVQATYKIIDTKLSVGVTGGLSTNFLVGNNATITQNGINLSYGSTGNLRNVLYSGSAGIELGYGLGKNLILTVEPRVKQYLNSVSNNDQVNYKPLQMGIFTGLTYSFN